MLDLIYKKLGLLLGLGEKDINLYHMCFRFLIIYIFGIIILNFFTKRFIGEKTPFDIILRFVMGSSLANAITGSSPYFPTLGMVLFIIILNWILSYITLYNKFIDKILKGLPVKLYSNGKFNNNIMKKYHFTENDILSEIRKNGIEDLNHVKEIFLENSGEVSIVKKL